MTQLIRFSECFKSLNICEISCFPIFPHRQNLLLRLPSIIRCLLIRLVFRNGWCVAALWLRAISNLLEGKVIFCFSFGFLWGRNQSVPYISVAFVRRDPPDGDLWVEEAFERSARFGHFEGPFRSVAQLVERRSPKPKAAGSKPATPAIAPLLSQRSEDGEYSRVFPRNAP